MYQTRENPPSMPNYSNGKIYQIVFGDQPERCIESTVQPLKDRLSGHRTNPKGFVRRLMEEVDDRVSRTVHEIFIDEGKSGWEERETGKH